MKSALAALVGTASMVVLAYGPNIDSKSVKAQFTTRVTCPSNISLVEPGLNAENEIRASLYRLVPQMYPKTHEYTRWEVLKITPLPQAGAYYGIGARVCTEDVAKQSWFVELFFPNMVPNVTPLNRGQLFLAKSHEGWVAWYKYH